MLQEIKEFINKNDVLNVNAVSMPLRGGYGVDTKMTIFVWLNENTNKQFTIEGYHTDLSSMFLDIESYFKNNK